MSEKIQKTMTISDILETYPNSEQVMFEYGLHCTSCAGANIENMDQGAQSHGISPKTVDEIIEKINKKYSLYQENMKKYTISISKLAQQEVLDIQKEEEQQDSYLKIDAVEDDFDDLNYTIDFQEMKEESDTEIQIDKIKCLIPTEKQSLIAGIELDYIRNSHIDGFKITKPKKLLKD